MIQRVISSFRAGALASLIFGLVLVVDPIHLPAADSRTQGGLPVFRPSEPIILHASNAITHSVMMRYEPQTNKNCLGYWTNPNDWAEWLFRVAENGTYNIELWQGCGKGQGGSDVMLEIAGNEFPFVVEDTGHFQNFIPRNLGQVTLKNDQSLSLKIKPIRKKAGAVMDVQMVRLIPAARRVEEPAGNLRFQNRRVVFLGDSITHSGEYLEFVETYLRMRFPGNAFDFINLGLPSETVSGLSEPGHAGGTFPRPHLDERIQRVLEKTRPDLVVACYGMNDGIYCPFDKNRFEAFQKGMMRLREKAAASGAKVIHLTPPVFDPVPLRGKTLPAGLPEYRSPYEGYNEVLDRYSAWLIGQRGEGWEVVDIHEPMNRFLAERRRDDPKFQLAGDGVHANPQGHWLIAREILRQLAAPESLLTNDTSDALLGLHPRAAEILKLVQQRQRVLRDAWLTEVGHQRPGMNKGKPLAEAKREAIALAEQLQKILTPNLTATRFGLFERTNLVAWCIVPFDSKKRGPEERAAMLERLGLKKFAYDYRAEHIPTFDTEILALQRHQIELLAWWFPTTLNDEARNILSVLKRHVVHPQLWVTGEGQAPRNAAEQREQITSEARRIQAIAYEAARIGCSVGLYNHGGWFGEPENQIAIIKQLRTQGITNVGIVYNLHHGHPHIDRFGELLQKMKPYLLVLNLNGMVRDAAQEKILPIGQGDYDLSLLKIIRDSGWQGPFGILNHTGEDAEARLLDNLDGLEWLVAQLDGKPPGPKPEPRSWKKPEPKTSRADSGNRNSWGTENAAEREKLPLYRTVPAAEPGELTPANGFPKKDTFLAWPPRPVAYVTQPS